MRGSKVKGNDLGEGLGCRGDVLPRENKVNSFSNQLKLSWVCKLEGSLTKMAVTVPLGIESMSNIL